MTRSTRVGGDAALPRDQRESAFSVILADLVARAAGAQAAMLVDSEGETVDYAGGANPFEMRVTAAHWRIVLDLVGRQRSLPGVRCFALRAERRSYVVSALPNGYALVLVLLRGLYLSTCHRAVAACVRDLEREAGWPPQPAAIHAWGGWGGGGTGVGAAGVGNDWYAVDVATDDRGRPRSAAPAGKATSFEILGTLVGLAGRERGWRVRVESGLELTLVREARGFWYADEPLLQRPLARRPIAVPQGGGGETNGATSRASGESRRPVSGASTARSGADAKEIQADGNNRGKILEKRNRVETR